MIEEELEVEDKRYVSDTKKVARKNKAVIMGHTHEPELKVIRK